MAILKKGIIHLLKLFTIYSTRDVLTPEQAKLLKLFQRLLAQFQIKVKAHWNKNAEQFRVFDIHDDDEKSQHLCSSVNRLSVKLFLIRRDWRVYQSYFSFFSFPMNMNENQTMTKNYILIVRTIHGEPDLNMTVCLRGSHGQTEKIPLGKSQVEKKNLMNTDPNSIFHLFSVV